MPGSNPSPPNVLLLTIDTLRYDELACFSRSAGSTPNLDSLAGRGVRFDQAITGGSWTQAAFPVLLTSSSASMYGGCTGRLAGERPSPISCLRSNGFTTAGFSTSPLLGESYGYQKGFDYFFDLRPQGSDPFLRRIKGGQKLLRSATFQSIAHRTVGSALFPAPLYVSARYAVDNCLEWLTGVQTPFFVWLHLMDVHWPYHVEDRLQGPGDAALYWGDLAHLHSANWNNQPITPEQRERYTVLYREAVEFVDAQVGRLVDGLRTLGHYLDTAIFVLSDHGEEFLEHGRWGHWEDNLFDEVLRVPFLIHLPRCQGERQVSEQISTLDVMPTILDLCGCPELEGLEGRSLVGLWQPEKGYSARSHVIAEMWREHWHKIAVRTPNLKYIWDSKNPDRPFLFDLQDDPGETLDVARERPDDVSDLHELVMAQLDRAGESTVSEAHLQPTLSSAVRQRLRDLGYVE